MNGTAGRAWWVRAFRLGAVMVLLCATGCLILPKSETTRSVENVRVERIVEDAKLKVSARVNNGAIEVLTYQLQTCQKRRTETVTVTKTMGAEMEVAGSGGGDEAVLIWLVLAPVTAAISGLITAIVVGVADDKVTESDVVRAGIKSDCSRPVKGAWVRLDRLPDASVVTDDKGRAVLAIPDDVRDGLLTLTVSHLPIEPRTVTIPLKTRSKGWVSSIRPIDLPPEN